MLATISGLVTESLPGAVIIEVGGIGYEVRVTTRDLTKLATGKKARLFMHEHIREDSHDLYGFSALEDKLAFEQLLGVSGVGPKVAQAIMSAITLTQLQSAVAAGQAEVLQAVAGVGNKMAARIVIELRNRLGDDLKSLLTDDQDTTFSALKQLGFSPQQARQAISKLPASAASDEERLKLALKGLAK